ncbi:MAG TPA: PTS sugar transporter subunit IIA [Planctomycetota bacterium]|nr:PTS sugar transporter subunit IIA [Planctomycetota bacterium]
MNLSRYITEERIDLDLDAAFDAEHPPDHEAVVRHLATLLERSADIVNASKLLTDLANREKRAPSFPGHGVAMPHVRTLQARKLVLAVAVSRAGLPLPTPDGEPVHLLLALVGPPYDDKAYLNVYRALGERLEQPGWIDAVLQARAPGEVVRALSMPAVRGAGS